MDEGSKLAACTVCVPGLDRQIYTLQLFAQGIGNAGADRTRVGQNLERDDNASNDFHRGTHQLKYPGVAGILAG